MQNLIRLIEETLDMQIELDADTPLLSTGIVDSLGVVTLLGAIEDHYQIMIAESELSFSTFDTPRQMQRVIDDAYRA